MSTLELPHPEYTFFVTKDFQGAVAVTDSGRPLPLFHYEAVMVHPPGTPIASPTEKTRQEFLAAMEQKFLDNTKWQRGPIEKLFEPCGLANCHGWAFAAGRFGIHDSSVLDILQDNGYSVVDDARDGDLAVFAIESDVQHTGIVRIGRNGEMQIESKWGPFGVYLHSLTTLPYHGTPNFYRSPRPGHRLTIAKAN
jgi:hypothetical protein